MLGKPGFTRNKHTAGPKSLDYDNFNPTKILIVDDAISSGDSMIYAIKEIYNSYVAAIVGIAVSSIFPPGAVKIKKRFEFEVRMFVHQLGPRRGTFEEYKA
jgi:hypoxanthine phosphoribosyltransferase